MNATISTRAANVRLLAGLKVQALLKRQQLDANEHEKQSLHEQARGWHPGHLTGPRVAVDYSTSSEPLKLDACKQCQDEQLAGLDDISKRHAAIVEGVRQQFITKYGPDYKETALADEWAAATAAAFVAAWNQEQETDARRQAVPFEQLPEAPKMDALHQASLNLYAELAALNNDYERLEAELRDAAESVTAFEQLLADAELEATALLNGGPPEPDAPPGYLDPAVLVSAPNAPNAVELTLTAHQ